MAVRDWITSPPEWGDWGRRANAWFNNVKDCFDDHETRIADLESVEEASLTLATGYIHYTVGDWDGMKVRRNSNTGLVTIQGIIRNTGGSTLGAGHTMITLPSGWEPAERISLPGIYVGGNVLARCDIAPVARVIQSTALAVANNQFMLLNGSWYT